MEVDSNTKPDHVDSHKKLMDQDSMSEEEEYVPIDYAKYKGKKRKASYKRAVRTFVIDDHETIQYKQPSKKKRKPTNASTAIINNMKKNKDYDIRATTKILTSKPKESNVSKLNKATKSKSKQKTNRIRTNRTNSFIGGGTQQLIKQKTTQNSMHCTVSLTVQEKYLKQHYKTIAALLAKNKKKIEKTNENSFNGMKHLKEAMSNGLNTSFKRSAIIEPGEKGNNDETIHPLNETFIKRSTNYIQQRNTEQRKGIDIDYYFNKDTKPTLNEKERITLNQERAIAKLKQIGNTNIGNITGNIGNKEKKFSIKRRKKKILSSNNKMEICSKEETQDKEEMGEDSLNSGFDNLTNHDYLSPSDRTRVNLQKYELALKAAKDKSSAIDDEMHQENCNVYVGGLHPECDECMLRKLFKHCGDIKQIRLDWRKKGFGFIHYKTHEQAMEAIQDMDGRLIMGQPIKCRWAKSKLRMQQHEEKLKEKEENSNNNNDNTRDDINTNHPNPMYQRSVASNNNKIEADNVTSIGFLSKRMDLNMNQKLMNGPPALVKVKKNDDNESNDVENEEHVEYW